MSTLVLGGTGKTGAPIVRGLRARGVEVVAASRHGDRRFDWSAAETWSGALEGATRLYAIAPLGDERPQDRMLPFFEEALAASVQRIVLLSSSAVDEGGPGLGEVDHWVRTHAPEWTVLRPSWFMENFFEPGHFHAQTMAEEGRLVSATGQGRVPFVDAEDIAAVAVAALADDRPHDTAHRITGPEALSYDDVARTLGVRHDAVSPSAFVTFLTDRGLTPAYAEVLASLDARIAHGEQSTVTDTVKRVTGHDPRSFADFAKGHPPVDVHRRRRSPKPDEC